MRTKYDNNIYVKLNNRKGKTMKKMFVTTIAVTMFSMITISAFTSCCKEIPTSEIKITEQKGFTHRSANGNGSVLGIQKFEYEGHKYIAFHMDGTHGGSTSVVHDPDCGCTK